MARKKPTEAFTYSMTVTPFERKSWRVQRVAWASTLVILAVAAAGGLGAGPLSRATASAPDLEVHYAAVIRDNSPSGVAARGVATAPEFAIEVDSAFLAVILDLVFLPAPARTSPSPAGIIASWAATPGDSVTVVASGSVRGIGKRTVRVRRGSGGWIDLPLFVLP